MEKRQGDTTTDVGKIENNAREIDFALDPALNGNIPAPGDPPEGGYGWVVCGAVSLINGFTWGVAAVRPNPSHIHIINSPVHTTNSPTH
jgi:hypothetical protein